MLQAAFIAKLQKDAIIRWKENNTIDIQESDFLRFVEENHSFNYQLWHAEDLARREDKGFEFVYRAKRDIDHFNQQRNNRMEAMDDWLSEMLKPAPKEDCRVHSETPGMIIDRLSILALKSYHMELQTQRTDVDAQHIEQCQQKLNTINEQRAQLTTCLDELFEDVLAKKRTFRLYRQFKMYNDPALNPELHGNK